MSADVQHNPWSRWERTRQMGKQAFIWSRGVFAWGLLMTLFFELINFADNRNHPGFLGLCILIPILALPGGYLFGLLTWNEKERRYQNYAMLREIRDRLREQDSPGPAE